jgi:hypothetical protein
MLQGTAPEEGALQSVRTTRVLVSKAPGPVNTFLPINFSLDRRPQQR